MRRTSDNGGGKNWGWYVKDDWFRRWNGTPDWWKNFLLRLPGSWTTNQLATELQSAAMLDYVRDNFPGDWRYNAFLNPYWDPAVNDWMRFIAPNDPTAYSQMRSNYWGTDTTTLIDHAIIDYYDNFLSARVDYGDPPAHGYTNTYPFVESVLINGVSAATVPQIESGPTTFTVAFNRDMNTNIEPFVTFGPAPPYTDFQVKARDANFIEKANGWINSRTWEGQVWITPVTGNGYHLMRISDAVAASDPWLVSGYDVGRFRFNVQTVGVASMTLQANGGEGKVGLSWQQNDYDLVAGYNVYRSDAPDGTYTRLNNTLIPVGGESYTDTNVVPAVPMFYKFSVVTTDFQESDLSEAASAAAYDTIPPVLTHTPVTSAIPGLQLRISATASDNVRVTSVTLYYHALGASNYTSASMLNAISNQWSATIPASAVKPPGLEYFLVAGDGSSQVYSGTAAVPHTISVNDQPTLSSVTPNHGSSAGGTPVSLAGLQFKPGCSVLFGGVLASNIVVLSANQITCVTPPHFPATVQVEVLNTNGTSATLLNAFTFESVGTVVSLPETNADYGSTVDIPLSADGVTGLRAADVTVTYHPSIMKAFSARTGPLTSGWTLTANTNVAGRITISLASATSVSGSGGIAYLTFQIMAHPPASTALSITNVSLNDGAMAATISPGLFTVNGFWDISGTVRYFKGGGPLPDAELGLAGVGARAVTSQSNGGFSLTNLPTGSYTLTPSKSNDVAAITAYDASLALQSAAGLITLSSNEFLAADVNRNGMVSSLDAAYLLEYSVGLSALPFPNAAKSGISFQKAAPTLC